MQVRGGLATVHELAPATLHLWLQAPDVTLDLVTAAGAPPIEIIAGNALSDAALAALAPVAGVGVGVEPIAATAAPTERRWRVTPPRRRRRVDPAHRAPGRRHRRGRGASPCSPTSRRRSIACRTSTGGCPRTPGIRFAVMSRRSDPDAARPSSWPASRPRCSGLPFPIYATLGNHELGTRDDLFHDYFGRGNFSFVFRNVQFTLLDTASATLAPVVYDWLGGWLIEGIDRVHFVFAHIPPLDPIGTRNGAFASRLEANKLLSLLASGKVDTTFYGHVHSYYAYSNAGIPAYITGGGGAIPEQLDGIGRHYLTVDVDPAAQTSQVAMVRVD